MTLYARCIRINILGDCHGHFINCTIDDNKIGEELDIHNGFAVYQYLVYCLSVTHDQPT